MKTAASFLFIAVSAVAQQRSVVTRPATPVPTPVPAEIQAPLQAATDITIHLTADVATAYETARINLLGPEVKDPTTGVATRTPQYATIQDYLTVLVSMIHSQVLKKYPPPSVQAKHDALAKAQADADAADAAALKEK